MPFPLQILCNSGHLTFVPLGDLPKTVEHLSLTNNNLSYLATDAFAGLRHLRKLTLDGNGIRAIERFAFRGLPRLRELSVQHTPLGSLKKFSFSGLQNVTAILLGYNQISVIDEFAFAGTANIRLILLNNNPLHTVSEPSAGVRRRRFVIISRETVDVTGGKRRIYFGCNSSFHSGSREGGVGGRV